MGDDVSASRAACDGTGCTCGWAWREKLAADCVISCCDGYHIYPTSAAIDQGVATGVRFDIDGQLRPSPGGYDLGADEITEPVWLPLILRNGP